MQAMDRKTEQTVGRGKLCMCACAYLFGGDTKLASSEHNSFTFSGRS